MILVFHIKTGVYNYPINGNIIEEQSFSPLKIIYKDWMMTVIEKSLLAMVILRVLSGSIEVSAGLLMLKFNSLEKAFYINTMLALVGPTVLIVTTAIALFGLADKIPVARIICLFTGITLILISSHVK